LAIAGCNMLSIVLIIAGYINLGVIFYSMVMCLRVKDKARKKRYGMMFILFTIIFFGLAQIIAGHKFT
jgi:hypothetical protein